MLGDFKANGMFTECTHGNEYQPFVFVLTDYFDHFFSNVFFSLKVEDLIAVSVVKDHLINMQWNSLHFLDDFRFGMAESFLKREKNGIFLDHLIVISEISSKEDGTHVPLEKNHGWTWYVFGIKEVK